MQLTDDVLAQLKALEEMRANGVLTVTVKDGVITLFKFERSHKPDRVLDSRARYALP